MAKKKFPLRAFQYAKFLSVEADKKEVRKRLKVTPRRLEQMIHREGRKPTKRQQRILANMARTVASQKARRMGFTSEQVKKARGRPMLMLARARAMNEGLRKSQGISWQKAAGQLSMSFKGLAKIRKKKEREAAWDALRKVVSPGKFSTVEVKTAAKKLRRYQ